MDKENILPTTETQNQITLDNSSMQERTQYWQGKASSDSLKEWNDSIVKVFRNDETLKDPLQENRVSLYKSLGINPQDFSMLDASHLHETYFSAADGSSNIQKFVDDIENHYKARNTSELSKDDLNSIHWIGKLFGEKTSVQIVMKIQDDLRASAIPEKKSEAGYPEMGGKLSDSDKDLMKLAIDGLGDPAKWDTHKLHSIGYILSFKELQTTENTQLFKNVVDYLDAVKKIPGQENNADLTKIYPQADEVFRHLMTEKFDQKLIERLKESAAPIVNNEQSVSTKDESDPITTQLKPLENQDADTKFKELMSYMSGKISGDSLFTKLNDVTKSLQSQTTDEEKVYVCEQITQSLQGALDRNESTLIIDAASVEKAKNYIERLNETVRIFRKKIQDKAENTPTPVATEAPIQDAQVERPVSKINRLSTPSQYGQTVISPQIRVEPPISRLNRLSTSSIPDDIAA